MDRKHSVQLRLERLFEQMGLFFDSHPTYSADLIAAKDWYFGVTGRIKESDQDFGNRMNAFFLWFLFDWNLPTGGRPVDRYLAYLQETSTTREAELLHQQQAHHHSLFDFIKHKSELCIIKDVLTGQKHKIQEGWTGLEHNKGSLFEARLFTDNGVNCLANYFIHHPLEVRRAILKKVARIRKEKSSIKPFLIQLHTFHTKWVKYRNIHIKSIYHLDNSRPMAK
jgi:hypothetical protein